MNKLNIGILGFASIAIKAIIPAVVQSEYFELRGIASRNSDNKEVIENKYSCKFYNEYEAMVDDQSIDALYIPLPNSLHYPWAKKALENGKHLLVEKSLACSYQDVERLNDLAKQNNLAIVENFQFRKHSQLAKIKEIIGNNQLGEIRAIKSSFGFPPFPDKNNIRYIKELGGGALLDAGAYPIKLAQELLGFDIKITSALLEYEGQEVDIWGAGMLQQENASNFVQFSFGFDHHYQCSLEIWGSKAKLFTNRIFTAPPEYEPTVIVESREGQETLTLDADNHYVNMLKHFYNCTQDQDLRTMEYRANNTQAKLLEDFYNLAHS